MDIIAPEGFTIINRGGRGSKKLMAHKTEKSISVTGVPNFEETVQQPRFYFAATKTGKSFGVAMNPEGDYQFSPPTTGTSLRSRNPEILSNLVEGDYLGKADGPWWIFNLIEEGTNDNEE